MCEFTSLIIFRKENTILRAYPVTWYLLSTLLCFSSSSVLLSLTLHCVLIFWLFVSVCGCLIECVAISTLKRRRWAFLGREGGLQMVFVISGYICFHSNPIWAPQHTHKAAKYSLFVFFCFCTHRPGTLWCRQKNCAAGHSRDGLLSWMVAAKMMMPGNLYHVWFLCSYCVILTLQCHVAGDQP